MENILKVDGLTLPAPSKMGWGLMDLAGPNAGRDMAGTMHKNKIGEKRKISLSWINKTPEETSKILKAFQPEYVNITYHDALENKIITKRFYSGDKSAPVKSWCTNYKRYSEITFNVIEA